MRVNHLLFWMLFSYSRICAAQTAQIAPEWATFSTPINGSPPPPELHSKIKSGPVTIRVFFPSGDYGQLGCYAIRQGDGRVSISRGDGDVVAIGRWHQEHDQLVVTSRIVYRTVNIKGRPIPEADTVEKLSFRKGQYWTVWNKEYRYVPLPQFKDWGYLTDLIRCDREYFDGEKHVDGVQPCMPSSEIDKRVAALIEKMSDQKTEQQAFTDLESLGCPAVPAIIERMDDRRKLPEPRISLQNKSPDAFEGLRHYGPEKVVDALAAILNQITGKDFGFIYNGATDTERDKAVSGWRDFLYKTDAAKLCEGG
jgi:hypothetical protein